MRAATVAGFLVAILPLIATPGASLTLLIARVGSGGRRQAAPVILGTATGLYTHATLAAIGLSALVVSSSQAFEAVRLAGALYLIALGVSTLRSVGAGTTSQAEPGVRSLPWSGRPTYVHAVLGNVLNPKAASIFLTLVPQFLDPHRPIVTQILILATAQVALVTCWLLLWTAVIECTARSARGTRFKKSMQGTAGAVLITLGLRTAITR